MRERLLMAKTAAGRLAQLLEERPEKRDEGDTGHETQSESTGAGGNRGAGG